MAINTDFFAFDELYSDEQLAIRDEVRKLVDADVLPHVGAWCDEGVFPMAIAKKLGELGVLGCPYPEKYGCAGTDYTTYGLAMQELERGDTGLRSFASVQTSLTMFPIFAFGSEEQRMAYLPKLATAEMIGCFGLTEPFGGSNPGGMRTRATDDGDSWILNGEKMWITNGGIADIAVVFAQTGEEGNSKTVRGFVIHKDDKGFSAPEIKKKIGLRASVTSSLVMQDCRIPKNRLLPGTEAGLKCALQCLNNARYGICFGAVGAAMACYEEAVEFTSVRAPFGRSLDHYQLIQAKLAQTLTNITLAQALNYRLGQLKDSGKITPVQVSLAKRNNVRMALNVASVCREMLGASGITYEHASGRHETNLISVDTYEGTHDVHTLVLGAEITGKPAFK